MAHATRTSGNQGLESAMHILMIDDRYEDLKPLISPIFEAVGDIVTYAWGRADAERALESTNFGVIILDGNLEDDVTGPSVLRRWKEEGRRVPPVVMLSADHGLVAEGIKAGAVGGFNKEDIDVDEFVQSIQSLAEE